MARGGKKNASELRRIRRTLLSIIYTLSALSGAGFFAGTYPSVRVSSVEWQRNRLKPIAKELREELLWKASITSVPARARARAPYFYSALLGI